MHDDERLVTIALFDTVWEACIARGALEGAVIRALVPEEHLLRSGRFPAGSLQVLESDRDRAHRASPKPDPSGIADHVWSIEEIVTLLEPEV